MKNTLTLFALVLMLSVSASGQEILGKINSVNGGGKNDIIWVVAKKSSSNQYPNKAIHSAVDSLGNFRLVFDEAGDYEISINSIVEFDTTFFATILNKEILRLTINYPVKNCPYEKTKLSGMCPLGNHMDDVIPIYYGFLVSMTLEVEDSVGNIINKEPEEYLPKEYMSGGCQTTDCDPNWYCKRHDKKF